MSNLGEGAGNSVTAVAGGLYTGIALLSSGEVMTWGDGIRTHLSPELVGGLSEVVAVASAQNSFLALRSNGTVVAWGENKRGELGDGTTENSATPVEVTGLHEVVAISASDQHCLALLANGTVMAWGEGDDGQLGNDERADSDVPVQVLTAHHKPLSEVSAISAGGAGTDAEDSLALKRDGTVWVWGNGEYGQAGNGKFTHRHSLPVEVEGLGGTATAIAAGGRGNLALLSTGKVMSWGWNGRNELGNGVSPSIEERSAVPVEVSGLEDVTEIAAGESFRMALLSNGKLMAWGWNAYDEIGNEALTSEEEITRPEGTAGSTTPLPVSGLSNVVGMAGATEHAFAIVAE